MSERSANAVRARLADVEPEVRRRATQDIPTLAAPESYELLLLALGDEDWRVRKEAASVAMRIEPRTAVVFAVARALAEHENIGLRNAAVEALVLIGPDAVPGAIDALGRLDADGRKLAIEVLAGAPTLAGMRTVARSSTDDDVNVVVAVAEALGRADLAGDEARELATRTLTSLLGSEHTHVRVAALDSLRSLEVEVPWSSLEPLLADPLLKRTAIATAGGSVVPRALLSLASSIADENPTLAREATVAFGRSLEEAWGDEMLLEVAIKTLRASDSARSRLRMLAKDVDDSSARAAAILAIGLVRDPDDVPILIDALADADVADRAEAALRLYGRDAVETLLASGRTAAPTLRGVSLSMLPELASSEGTPLAAVREALGDPSVEVVASALKSLAIVGLAEDLPSITRHVRSVDPKVASAAEAALLAIATRHPEAARAMTRSVDPSGDDALWASILLEAVAPVVATDSSSFDFLTTALTHREAAARRAAIEALAATGGDAAALAVTVLLADEEAVVALAAIRALGRLGRGEMLASLAATTKDPIRLGTVLRALAEADPERAFAAARLLVRAPEPSIAAAAIDVIGGIEIDGHAEALMSATDHPDHEVVKLALGEIAKLRDERALVALTSAMEHPAESVRRFAAELLGQSGPESEGILRARLDRERSAEVRRAIMQALASRPGTDT